MVCAGFAGPTTRIMCPAAMLMAASAATAAASPATFATRGHESVPRLPRSSADAPYGGASMGPPFILLVQPASGRRVTYPHPATQHRYGHGGTVVPADNPY